MGSRQFMYAAFLQQLIIQVSAKLKNRTKGLPIEPRDGRLLTN